MENINCNICDSQAEIYPRLADKTDFNCTNCGRYSITGSFQIESCFKDKTNFYKVSSWIREQNDLFQNHPIIDYEKFEEILNIKDKRIQEKFDLMMHYLYDVRSSSNINKTIFIKCWIQDAEELNNLFQKAIDSYFITGEVIRTDRKSVV